MKNYLLPLLAAFAFLVTACGGGGGPSNTPPTSSFTYSAQDLTVQFTSTSSDPDGTIQSYAWAFGDGATASTASPTHTYSSEGSYTVSLTVTDDKGASSTSQQQLTVTAPAAGTFTLSTDPGNNSVTAGGPPVFVNLYVNRTGGFGGAVTLELFGAPEGITGAFDPNPATGNQSQLSLSAGSNVAAGDYTLAVRGISGEETATLNVPLTVLNDGNPATFGLSVNPAELNIAQGQSGATTVTINRSGGFSSDVTLSVTGLPSGVTASFAPNPAVDSSTLTLNVANSATPGNYTLTVTGNGGGVQTSTPLGLTIPAPVPTDPGDASISGTLQTDNYLGNYTVPSTVNGGQIAAASVTTRPAYVPGQLLVQFEPVSSMTTQGTVAPSYQVELGSLANDYNLEVLKMGDAETPALVELAPGDDVLRAARELSMDPRVRYAEPNFYIYPMSIPNDPLFNQQWYLAADGVPVGWNKQLSAPAVTVAVLDSGYDLTHPDLSGIFVNNGYDFCATSSCTTRDAVVTPDGANDTHGTHVAGIIAAKGNNGVGVAGVVRSGAAVVPVKVFYNFNFTTAEALANAIRWAAGLTVTGVPANPNPAKILNMSLGFSGSSQAIADSVTAAQNAGALLIAASGNAGVNGVLYPAAYPGVIGVGSVNSQFTRSCFSNYGTGLDIVAAGGDGFLQTSDCAAATQESLLSTIPYNDYGTLVGTSQAAPVVSGTAALVWQQNPGFTADQVTNKLTSTAYKESYMTTSEYGAGVLRADLALGMPGPGTQASVQAQGTTDSGVGTATLNLSGASTTYTVPNLESGSYTLTATAQGVSGSLTGTRTVSLAKSEAKTGIVIELK